LAATPNDALSRNIAKISAATASTRIRPALGAAQETRALRLDESKTAHVPPRG
jgi:hypothetical protein